jgi:hypothetical protein
MQDFSLSVLATPPFQYITCELYLQISPLISDHIQFSLIRRFSSLFISMLLLSYAHVPGAKLIKPYVSVMIGDHLRNFQFDHTTPFHPTLLQSHSALSFQDDHMCIYYSF